MTSVIRSLLLALALIGLPVATAAQAPKPAESEAAMAARYRALLESLHPQTGRIRVPGAHAVLDLGQAYYFLPADEAKRVLTEGWNNPADGVSDVLGMVFPAGKTFLDDSWGAVLTFKNSGYIDDSDAREIDYDEVLTSMKEATAERSKQLAERGLETQQLVGWAQPPTYDPVRKSMVWATDLRFSRASADTLNYDVRLLGRHGVISLNMVAGMKDLATVRTAAASFAQAVSFESGERYADYNPATDSKAEYGLAGLVAAGAGAAAAKKLGLLGIIAAFGKKFIVLIGVAFAAIVGFFRRLLGRKADDEA